jgi:hypothetical protein
LPRSRLETGSFSPVGIYGRTVGVCAERARELLLLGLLVFIPLGLIDALVDHVHVDTGVDSALLIAGAIAVGVMQAFSTLIGEIFYSGAVAGLLTSPAEEKMVPSRVVRHLPFGRLIAADVLFAAGAILGLLLLVVPGVIFFTWFGLVAPLIEIEKRGVREAFAHSRALVRGHFWSVLAVLGPITLGSSALINAIGKVGHDLLGQTFWATWLSEGIGNVLVSPFYAVPTVLLTLKLIEIKSDS